MIQGFIDITDTQHTIIFWMTKIGGGSSIICSLYLIMKILRDHIRRKKFYHRIIVALSMNAVLFAGAIFCNSWPTPKSFSIRGAAGTQRTCDAQGAVLSFTSMTLSSYYLLLSAFAFYSVRNNFDETWFLKFELRVHISIYVIPTIFTVIALANGLMNPLGQRCGVNVFPPGCHLDDKVGKCIRGGGRVYKYFVSIRLFLFGTSMLISLIFFIGLIISIRRKEKINAKLIEEKFEEMYRGKELFRESARKKKSIIIAQQASIYMMMYLFTFLIPFSLRVYITLHKENVSFVWICCSVLCTSLVGCFSLIIYLLLLKRKPDPAHICTMAPLRDRIYLSPSQELALNPPEEVSKICLGRPEFSIFDGTNPSDSPWAQFIDEFSDNETDINNIEIQEIVP